MRRYETIFISDPDLPEDSRAALFEKMQGLIAENDGYIAFFDEWGARKLAYEVKKKKRGYYVLMDFCAEGSLIAEMERIMRIDDRILKFLTIQTEEEVDLDAVKEQVAKAKAEKEAAQKAAAEKAEAARLEAEKAAEEEAAKAAEAPVEEAKAEEAPAEAPAEEPAEEPKSDEEDA
ncbi:SSU ribosomal protein S6P [Desulfatibacillum alkenivorans DSM 16219]|jgi:small subunit ribosomal protein S6|uniref:Small ribosomal subunit protein bS6 n=1 Tax=Desulfatibacillum alkenivorans DSM 16219 TaxID=1121393 RepID=A0A1M6HUU0_9BACT|nr:30S ribosomal protein S6 [Desulfatibacillum alkenivorans]SHJ25963.1 SSU ribosomal protein S6P [Desulfatibacillum alkenivorans DSM 16219]